LLFHFGGVALRAGNRAGLVFLKAHDAHKLRAALDADIFIGWHDASPDYQIKYLLYNNNSGFRGWLQEMAGERKKYPASPAVMSSIIKIA
jgi:hypothetical protein